MGTTAVNNKIKNKKTNNIKNKKTNNIKNKYSLRVGCIINLKNILKSDYEIERLKITSEILFPMAIDIIKIIIDYTAYKNILLLVGSNPLNDQTNNIHKQNSVESANVFYYLHNEKEWIKIAIDIKYPCDEKEELLNASANNHHRQKIYNDFMISHNSELIAYFPTPYKYIEGSSLIEEYDNGSNISKYIHIENNIDNIIGIQFDKGITNINTDAYNNNKIILQTQKIKCPLIYGYSCNNTLTKVHKGILYALKFLMAPNYITQTNECILLCYDSINKIWKTLHKLTLKYLSSYVFISTDNELLLLSNLNDAFSFSDGQMSMVPNLKLPKNWYGQISGQYMNKCIYICITRINNMGCGYFKLSYDKFNMKDNMQWESLPLPALESSFQKLEFLKY